MTQQHKPQPVVQVAIAKYKHGRTEADGEPDEVVIIKEQWLDRDGRLTDDPERIEQFKREVGA